MRVLPESRWGAAVILSGVAVGTFALSGCGDVMNKVAPQVGSVEQPTPPAGSKTLEKSDNGVTSKLWFNDDNQSGGLSSRFSKDGDSIPYESVSFHCEGDKLVFSDAQLFGQKADVSTSHDESSMNFAPCDDGHFSSDALAKFTQAFQSNQIH